MSLQLAMPVERSLISVDPVHQINDFRSFLNVLGDPQVNIIFYLSLNIFKKLKEKKSSF
jgi:hypothetical protein